MPPLARLYCEFVYPREAERLYRDDRDVQHDWQIAPPSR